MTHEEILAEHLSAIQADMSRMANRMDAVAAEMRATRQHVAGLVALQDHDHVELSQIKLRLEHIERHLNLIE